MEDRLKQEVLVFARRLAVQEKDRLAKLGTFIEIEDLTVEIGDELSKQLAQNILSERAEEAVAAPRHVCPDCGTEAPPEEEREPLSDPSRETRRDQIQRTGLLLHSMSSAFFSRWPAN